MTLIVKQVGSRRWQLMYPLRWAEIEVPAGFVTDFASTPRWLWWLVPPYGTYAWPSVIHDWLYFTDTGGTRREADEAFREAMQDAGVPRWQRWLLYVGVRIGGVGRGHWR